MALMGLSVTASALTSLAAGLAASLVGGPKPLFELRAGPFGQDEFVVLELHGQEGISKLFEFELVVASRLEAAVDLAGLAQNAFGTLDQSLGAGTLGQAVGGLAGRAVGSLVADAEATALEMLLLGQPATLVLHSPHAPPRVIQGICSSIERLGPLGGESSDWLGYRLVLRPRLWLTTLRKNSRVFQDVTVREVITTILHEHRIPASWTGGSVFPPRVYTIQHQESDYDFITRLLAELGCFYYFEPLVGLAEALFGGAVVASVTQLTTTLGGPLGQLADVAGFTENLIIADCAPCYSPIARRDPFDPWGIAQTVARGTASLVEGASGTLSAGLRVDSRGVHLDASAAGATRGTPLAVLGALGRLANASPSVVFQELSGLSSSEDFIFQFTLERTLRPKRVTLRDFDYNHPNLKLTAHAKADPSAAGAVEGFGHGERLLALNTEITSPALIPSQELEIYDHHDEYQETDVNRNHAQIQLEQYRRDARVADGQSVCQRLAPGYRFSLEEHPLPSCNKEFAVTHLEHWGQVPEWKPAFRSEAFLHNDQDAVLSLNYRNHFECVPAGIAYRMPRPARKVFQVTETATVVGPGTNEIFTDRQGRIKVQFHWDREGTRDGDSSCWLRVVQAWSGAGWGHQFIPRVGMEVLVTFLGGDLDKPVVIGSLPNANHPMPFPLPRATRSGIRTQSTPGGEGWNELSFEDARNAEEVYLHAQRDLREVVRNDHATQVAGHQRIDVTRSQYETIHGERHDTVGGDEVRTVKGTQFSTVRGDQKQSILGNRADRVDGSSNLTVHGLSLTDHGNQNVTVLGHANAVIGTEKEPGSYNVNVYGPLAQDATGAFTLSSDQQIVLKCGDSAIRITPKAIYLEAKSILLSASESLMAAADGPRLDLTDTATLCSERIHMFSAGGSLELDEKAAHVDAPKILLNSGPGKAKHDSAQDKPTTKPFKWRMLDSSLEPYKDKTYTLQTQGFKTKGTTDSDGHIDLELPAEAFSANICLWTDSYPTGERLLYTVRLAMLPPASSAYGAQIRLTNLGYFAGRASDETTPEAETALRNFQTDHGLAPSGELDGPTVAKLDEVHPAGA